jgi:hypothetical protein
MSQPAQGMLYGAARTGEPGNAVLVAAARMGQSADGLEEIAEGVKGSMQLGPAGAQQTYISIEGASASNESSDEHMGMWWLVSDIIGNGMLVLEATDGRYFQWSVREEGNTLNVEGSTYYLQRSQRCN